jgi:antitoxin CptB
MVMITGWPAFAGHDNLKSFNLKIPLTFGAPHSIYPSPGRVRAFGVWRCDEVGLAMTERSSAGLDMRRRKLLFRAWRRGVREMDLIVGRFADAYIDEFNAPALDDFERLIEVPNAELYAWVVGEQTIPADYDNKVLRQLISFHMRAEAAR